MRHTVKKTVRRRPPGRHRPDRAGQEQPPTLHDKITAASATTPPLSSHHSHDKARNRDQSRTVCVFDPAGKLDDREWQAHAKAIIRVERVVDTRSARTGLPSRAAEAIRAHWGIETTSRYSRDVTLAEDRSRIRTNPAVFARLRSFGFNSSRQTKSRRSVRTATVPLSEASTVSHGS
jgi:hypothetical protein